VVNFGTAWENIGVPVCTVNCGAHRRLLCADACAEFSLCAVSTHIVMCTWGVQVFLNTEEFCWYVHKYEYKLSRDSVFSSARR
jgi:hypothetical protein